MNTFDIVVAGILGLSMIVAFFRGFIRELLSLGAWVGAAIVTIYLFPHSTAFMEHHLHGGSKTGTVAAGAGALGTYILALIVFSIINAIILRYVKTGAEVGLLDNFLGLVFGAARGIFILSLGYLIMSATISKDNLPEWLKGSITRPYVETSAGVLADIAPHYLHDIEGFVKKEEDRAREEQSPVQDGDTNGSVTTNPNMNSIVNQIRSNAPQGTQQDNSYTAPTNSYGQR